MTNFLAGMQYADRKKPFPSWNDSPSDVYYMWKDVTDPNIVFASGTRIRMKPEYDYHLVVNDGGPMHFGHKDTLMTAVARHVLNGDTVKISSAPSTRSAKIKNLQANTMDRNGDWQDYSLGASPLVVSRPMVFRIRPDHYHIVDSIDPINKGSLDFHDIEKLAKYVDNRIRTNGLDFSVRKVKYGN